MHVAVYYNMMKLISLIGMYYYYIIFSFSTKHVKPIEYVVCFLFGYDEICEKDKLCVSKCQYCKHQTLDWNGNKQSNVNDGINK